MCAYDEHVPGHFLHTLAKPYNKFSSVHSRGLSSLAKTSLDSPSEEKKNINEMSILEKEKC